MTTTARILLTLACVVLLIAYGGAGDNQRVYFGLSLAGVLLLLAIGMKSQLRLPPLRWLAVLFIPLLALPLLQIIPWGWHHPWLSDDVTLLQVTIAQWSLDPSATFDALFWTLTLSALGLSASLLWRGERVVNLVKGLITIAAATAVLGFLLALMGVEWPSDSSTTRVRGPFIYPNHAAAFWTAILPLAMLMAQRQRQQHLLLRWGSVAIIALAILLSASRGGIIVASVICLPLALTLLPRHGRYRWGLGLSFGIATWLWIIGLGDVISRFDQLRGVDGLTLSGRMTIWQYAWPTIMDAGALGSGAGTTTVAYRRSADTTFTDGIVNHLHSDPLEWWLEYGWIGLIALIGSMVWLIYLAKQNPTTTNEHVALRRGAALGLLALCLHAVGDFVWHSAAVAGVGLLLVVVVMLAGGNGLKQQPQSSRWLRLTCLLLALSLLFCAWPSWQHVRSDLAARDAERHLVARAAANLPLTTGKAIDALRTLPSDSIRLANAQAWLARIEQRPADAEHILQLAAVLAPGDAAAWMERALLAGERGDQTLMRVAIGRALHWAPMWPDVQQAALRLVSGYGQAALPPEEAKGILLSMLQQDRSQAPWFFSLCERILGAEFLSQQLLVSQPNLARSSERWVAANSSVHQWLTLRQRLGPPSASSVWMAPITSLLYGTEPVPEIMPAGAEARRQLAEDLLRAGMPIPSSLSQMISADGPLYALWAQPFDLISPPIRESMSLLLRSELHRTWAKPWADRLSMMTRAQTGDTTSIGRDSDPLIIAWLAGLHSEFSPPVTISHDERQRITALLSRWNEWEWTNVDDLQVRWSWRYHGSQRSAMITTLTWTAVVIDGVWQGWIRGTTDIGPLIGSGLHRIVLISP